MAGMPNQSYLRVWCQDVPEEKIIERLGTFLATVPYSAAKPGFTYLTIRAVDSTETPIFEQDLRPLPLDTAGILELAKDHLHADCAYETSTHWDLWDFDPAKEPGFRSDSQPLDIFCYGEEYDGGIWQEYGHFQANLGFEDFFLGRAGLLGTGDQPARPAESPEEARFLEAMAWPENLERYEEKMRENIRRLMEGIKRIEKAMPEARIELWSEGEENFEERIEEILAAR